MVEGKEAVTWTCESCGTTWAEGDLVKAFNAMTATLLNRELWPRPVTRLAEVLCCPTCLTERTQP